MAVLLLLCTVLVFERVFEHLEPMGKRLIEDTLGDNSLVMAQLFMPLLQSGQIYDPQVQASLDSSFADLAKQPNVARSFINPPYHTDNTQHPNRQDPRHLTQHVGDDYQHKTHALLRMYVTDAKGMVIYDSLPDHLGNAEGQNYSQWNDVYLTLQGKYGARSTRSDPSDAATSVMYVAKPIISPQGELLGVVSIGKPTVTMKPYVGFAKKQMYQTLFWLVLIALIVSALMAAWLQQSILMVKHYTQSLANDAIKPNFYLGKELNDLTDTIKEMKEEIENKGYVTDYVHTLTHELKSPLTAIKASGELLQEELTDADRTLLSQSIVEQSDKLQTLIERLLLLAKLEAPTFRLQSGLVNVMTLLNDAVSTRLPWLSHAHVSVSYWQYLPTLTQTTTHPLQAVEPSKLCAICPNLSADAFWLGQAVDNVVGNAVQFAKHRVWVVLWVNAHQAKKEVVLAVVNDGNLIPDYALDKVFERYFSLAHHAPDTLSGNTQTAQPTQTRTAKKGSGIGLTLAKEVINHHGGRLQLHNLPLSNNPPSRQIDDDTHALLTALSVYLNESPTDATKNKHPTTGVAAVIRLPIT